MSDSDLSAGPGVDAQGRPVVDPTQNVRELVVAAIERQDDLRILDSQWRDKMSARDLEHAREMRAAEAARIDAIRAVDVENVRQRAVEAEQRASTLANTVAATASAFDAKLVTELDQLKKDIADLRRVQYEGVGQKTQVVETRGQIGTVQAIIGLGIATLAAIGIYLGARSPHIVVTPTAPVTVTVPVTTAP